MTSWLRQHPGALTVDFGPKAPEAQDVVAIGADATSILKPGRPLDAAAADVTVRSEQAAECGA